MQKNKVSIDLNGVSVSISPELQKFQLYQKPSSNVDFFGVNKKEKQLFVQFKNGFSYMHSKIPANLLDEAVQSESIGSFYSKHIRGKYPTEISSLIVEPLKQQP